ncbi:hypothetical protein [Kitasatospora sp. NPDC005856]|uniref:hypothetical protein n=1 Tax=Kitasatospora sp. NPDC005856 TaxID=3154566 RepID=UPI00340CE7BD
MSTVRARLSRPLAVTALAAALAAGLLTGGLALAGPGARHTAAVAPATATPLSQDDVDDADAPTSTEQPNITTADTTTADTTTAQAVKASCGSSASGFANTWGPVSRSNCSVLGSKGHQVTYTFWIPAGTQQVATVRVWGIDGNNKGRWYNAGTIKSSGQTHRITVPWGNNAATPRVQVKGGASSVFSGVRWTH